MRQRFFNTSWWPQTKFSANNQISTFSQSSKFPLFLKFWSLQIFLNKICNQTKHSATTTSLKKSHEPFLDQTLYYQHLLTFSCGFARKNGDNRVNYKKLTSAAAPGLRLRRTQKRYMQACISFRATGLRPSDYYCMKNIFNFFRYRWNVDIVHYFCDFC